MSAIKRHIEDRCEEIAKETGLNYDIVLDIFNNVSGRNMLGRLNMVLVEDDGMWNYIKNVAKMVSTYETAKLERDEASREVPTDESPIKTGYIPVEYNLYKDLIEKAKKYDILVKEYNALVEKILYDYKYYYGDEERSPRAAYEAIRKAVAF